MYEVTYTTYEGATKSVFFENIMSAVSLCEWFNEQRVHYRTSVAVIDKLNEQTTDHLGCELDAPSMWEVAQ